jgi:hypothetical protein
MREKACVFVDGENVRLREFMGLDSPRAALNDDSTIVATEAVS